MTDSEILKVIYKMSLDETSPPDFFKGFVGALASGMVRIDGLDEHGEPKIKMTEKGEFDVRKLMKEPREGGGR
jgi:hypothetical protein